jgi:hypothetical protein
MIIKLLSMEILLLFVLALICAFLSSSIAGAKGLSPEKWWIVGFLFGPLGLIAAAGLPDRKLRSYLKFLAKENGWKEENEKDSESLGLSPADAQRKRILGG